MTTEKMDREARQQTFKRLFESIPGSKVERIRKVAHILCCEENTVRIYIMSNPTRTIPQVKLNHLIEKLEKPASAE